MTASVLILVAISVHLRLRMFERLDRATAEREQAQESLRQSHDRLELIVEQRTSALHQLSSRLLQAQDEERRKIARELHDSVGQYLASLKISLDLLAGSNTSPTPRMGTSAELLSECLDSVRRCIAETRTLSHLLHPPLLDEVGLASAARWYVDGFAKRSGIQVNLELPIELVRLPDSVELALFRVLQESLTNVNRHSGSQAVDIRLNIDAKRVMLEVRDYGRGISRELLQRFRETGTGVGVGLAGIRERVTELGGRLEILSDDQGTVLSVAMPLSQTKVEARFGVSL